MVLLLFLLLWLRAPMFFPSKVRWLLMSVLAVGFILIQQPVGSVAQPPMEANRLADDSHRTSGGQQPPGTGLAKSSSQPRLAKRREGTSIDSVPGRVLEIGRRWAFVTDSENQTYRILENLALERIARAIRVEPTDIRWSVSGTLTEFSGENYLLLSVVTRASGRRSNQDSTSESPATRGKEEESVALDTTATSR